jgi:hypothetical protein
MPRAKHPKKEVEEAVAYAESEGWRVEVGGGHAWGKIYCPYNDDECRCGVFCITCVWSTPRDAGNLANKLKRVVNNCIAHRAQKDEPKGE